MSDNTRKHVVPHQDGWAVKNEGASRASSVHSTQKQAQAAASSALRGNGGGEVFIHGENGQIRERNTIAPAKDPFPPKG